MLEYVRFLREEEKSHREYLETLYTSTLAVLGTLSDRGYCLDRFLQLKTKGREGRRRRPISTARSKKNCNKRMDEFRNS